MGLVELSFLAVGLSMDAFAVSLCKGLAMKWFQGRQAFIIALYFGAFQALMPFLGWLLGKQFQQYITEFDHWIAFALLAFLGGHMIWEARKEEACPYDEKLSHKGLILLAVATSIDALAVGITFSFFRVDILPAISLIGAVTFVLCFCGVALGNRFGGLLKGKAEIAGGLVLIGIGLKILLEHLNVF